MDASIRLLFSRLSAHQVHTYRLVLSASRIPHQLIKRERLWGIAVPKSHRRAAITAISLYLLENQDPTPTARITGGRAARTYSAAYVTIILLVVHWAIQPGDGRSTFVRAFGVDSAAVLNGEIHRCVTALLLHSDWAHLLANLFGLALFGTATAWLCGWGVAWLLILMAGALGNWCNAIWYGGGHLSVGASTAVFAAVGLCTVLAIADRLRRTRPSWRAWIPLGGGLALLAFMGADPRSDLMAHLFGFCAGMVLGGLYAWRWRNPLPWKVQAAAGALAVIVLVVSWMAGMARS